MYGISSFSSYSPNFQAKKKSFYQTTMESVRDKTKIPKDVSGEERSKLVDAQMAYLQAKLDSLDTLVELGESMPGDDDRARAYLNRQIELRYGKN